VSRDRKILLVQRADIDRYPPVLHQMRELSADASVTVLDRASDDSRGLAFANVRRIRVPAGESPSALRNFTEHAAFARALDRELDAGASVAIAYDPDAAALLLRSSHGDAALKRVVHLHELPDLAIGGRITRRSIRYLTSHLRRADLVLVPDQERARILTDAYSLTREPVVVMNCPMTLTNVPGSRLLPLLKARGFEKVRVVHYQGSVGPDHHLEQIVLSMQCWPQDAIFVVVGGGPDDFSARLRSLAESIGVQNRLVFIGRVRYEEVLSYAAGATIGVTLLDSTIDNWRFSAGASNKRFEYAALGIAQITNAGPGMDEIFGNPSLADLLSIVSADTIGESVVRLLADPSTTSAMGERARQAHLRENNYEAQFAPVLRQIESWEPVYS
jgi:glycosyltransferase involved in cell wall biosynthesis